MVQEWVGAGVKRILLNFLSHRCQSGGKLIELLTADDHGIGTSLDIVCRWWWWRRWWQVSVFHHGCVCNSSSGSCASLCLTSTSWISISMFCFYFAAFDASRRESEIDRSYFVFLPD